MREHTSTKHSSRPGRRIFSLALLVTMLLNLIQVGAAQAAPGDLDPSFDGDGKVTTRFTGTFPTDDLARSVAIQASETQPDGKLVVAGHTDRVATGIDFAVVRYNGDGGLDTSFGFGGIVTTDLGGYDDYAYSIARQADGKIVVAGFSYQGDTGFDAVVARYNSDGSLDTSFGSGGIVTTDLGGYDNFAVSVTLQADGKIVVAGPIYYQGSPNYADFLVVRYNSDGGLDTGFGSDGIVTTDFGNTDDRASALALQSDGKIVVAGLSRQGATGLDFAVARYHGNGDLDPDFGSGGVVTTDLGSAYDQSYSVALQPDGKIVVAGGWYLSTTEWDFALARYNSDGSLDNGFGSGGIVTTAFGNSTDFAFSANIQTDGKIVVAGFSRQGATGYDFAVVRYNSDGGLDLSFGTGGKVATDLGNYDDLSNSAALQSDGKIVVAGYSDQGATRDDFAVARYNSNGGLDAGFGTGGIVTTDIGEERPILADTTSVALQPDGKIVAVGTISQSSPTYWDFAVVRYNNHGGLDTGFGSGGIVTTDFGNGSDWGQSVALQPDGKIVVAGYSYQGATRLDFAVARYQSDGGLDTGFGSGGKVTTDLGGNYDYGQSVAIQSDGKIVVAGFSYQGANGYDFAVVRYNSNGDLDIGFGTGGKVTTDFGGSDHGYSVALQSDGKIVVAGYRYQGTTGYDFAVTRYNSDGGLDASFGSGGKVTTDLGSIHDYGQSVALQPDGQIVVAGYSYQGATGYDFAVARYNNDGSPDIGFGIGGKATTDFGSSDHGYSVALQSDGKIVLAGASYQGASGYDFAVVRYNSDGGLDTGFGTGGRVTTEFGSNEDRGKSVAIQSDGKIVVAGTTRDFFDPTRPQDLAVGRYVGDGEPPVVTGVSADPNPVMVHSGSAVSAKVDDSSTGNLYIASAEYSLDGGAWTAMAASDSGFDSPTESVQATLSGLTEAGVYQVCVRGTDAAGNTSSDDACTLIVVYDPDAGFVTGVGWIDSPAGAYVPDPSLSGRAHFAFVSKYNKGTTTPTGHTEFHFKVADLKFHSSSYEWLVVTGSNYARFKGEGNVNGASAPSGNLYKFMIWARDDTPDTFRIRIWDEDSSGNETDLYDNGSDQEIGGGKIIIHSKNK